MPIFKTPVFHNKKDPYDDSTLILEREFTLNDGRPVLAQVWAESGYTFLTYFFSSDGIERIKKDEILKYLQSGGIRLSESHTSTEPEIDRIVDLLLFQDGIISKNNGVSRGE